MSAPPATVAAALAWAAAHLGARGVDSPRRAARVLLGRAAGIDRARQLARPDAALAAADRACFANLVHRRGRREPLAYVAGTREFWSLDFAVDRATLVPRPESETAVAAALARVGAPPGRVLDLGTGSGCLLLALLSEWRSAFGVGVDVRADALAVAAANSRALGLARRTAFVAADWAAAAAAGAFDVVVCNPPYVESGAVAGLAPEIAYEPRHALDGGADGLACYRALLGGAARALRAGGTAVFEIGAGQRAAVERLMRAAGLGDIAAHPDLAGTIRCLSARRGTA